LSVFVVAFAATEGASPAAAWIARILA
jgi:hypothetical protein